MPTGPRRWTSAPRRSWRATYRPRPTWPSRRGCSTSCCPRSPRAPPRPCTRTGAGSTSTPRTHPGSRPPASSRACPGRRTASTMPPPSSSSATSRTLIMGIALSTRVIGENAHEPTRWPIKGLPSIPATGLNSKSLASAPTKAGQ